MSKVAMVATAAALAVAGCATQAERRAQPAAVQLESPRAVAAVRDCLVAELADVRQFGIPLAPPAVAQLRDGYTLSYPRGGRVFIDVLPRPGGSAVQYHAGLPMDVPVRVGEVVRACSAAA